MRKINLFLGLFLLLLFGCKSEDVTPDYVGNYIVFGGFVETNTTKYGYNNITTTMVDLNETNLSISVYVNNVLVHKKINDIHIANKSDLGFSVMNGNTEIAHVQKQEKGYYFYTYFTEYSDYYKQNIRVWIDAGKLF